MSHALPTLQYFIFAIATESLSTMHQYRKILLATVVVCFSLLMAGCTSDPILVTETLQLMTEYSQGVPPNTQRLESGQIDIPQPIAPQIQSETVESDNGDIAWAAWVTTKNSRVNIRSGPGLNYEPIAVADAGVIFKTYGKTEDGWWRICCFQGINDTPELPTQPAWVSEKVVEANQDAIVLPILASLFPNDVSATWDVRYRCGSDLCAEKRTCTATVTTNERSDLEQFWLVIDLEVKWADSCGQDSTWRHQLDRFDGKDLYAGQLEAGTFLTDYWRGANAGQASSLFTYSNEQKVMAWCDDWLNGEVEETDGWLNTYKGVACYDIRTGTLLSMIYVKRWLFSGEYAGEQYNRAYLGDFEMYEVTLNKTNILLAFR